MFHVAGTPPKELTLGIVHSVMHAGSHKPLRCQLNGRDGTLNWWVVKPQHSLGATEERTAMSVVAELAAAEVCAWVGLATPEIGLLQFPNSIEERFLPEEDREYLRNLFAVNAGHYAFCSRYLENSFDLVSTTHCSRCQSDAEAHREAELLYAIDAYIAHDDRTVERPNALTWGNRIVAIDHGSAFVGLDKRGRSAHDVARKTVRPPASYLSHPTRPAICGKQPKFESFRRSIEAVLNASIDALSANWPANLDHKVEGTNRGLRTQTTEFLKTRRAEVAQLIAEIIRTTEA
ncbi:MAG: hypothetical protein QM817_13225 [Archangium sp.]